MYLCTPIFNTHLVILYQGSRNKTPQANSEGKQNRENRTENATVDPMNVCLIMKRNEGRKMTGT